MILTLAFRHLWVRKLRSVFLLLGFALGVGVMIVLLSIGEAMLAQSRDAALVGGGEVTVLPEGIDVEAMRIGGVSGMFFGIDRARFLTRQLLGGPRQQDVVRAVAPAVENKVLYLEHGGRVSAVRAGGEIPSRAAAVGAGLDVVQGAWHDSPADSAYVAPTAQQLYDELDRFHLPPRPDSTWGEWYYFNLVTRPDEWWYVSLLVGGRIPGGPAGGQVLVTHRRPDARYERFTARIPLSEVALDTARVQLALGESFVRQRDGVYRVRARGAGASATLRLDFDLHPLPRRYFPPVELRADDFLSGYVVPALAGRASGRACIGRRCAVFENVAAYHDHNWGVWRGVTWEWGEASGRSASVLYGGVKGPGPAGGGAPYFLLLVDSLGVRQVLRFREIRYEGGQPAAGESNVHAPERFSILAARGADTTRLDVRVSEALASRVRAEGLERHFLQMRGRFSLQGRVAGRMLADSGWGFFETYVDGEPRRAGSR
ncbi:MAG TPA: hypothetical protein VFK09_03785 [Gemmatimonadales bacterium]|nr:hypothetical protein [Gemmatimonadales bacterium]